MDINLGRGTAVNSLFGTYTANDNGIVTLDNSHDVGIYDFILRDPTYKSLQFEIQDVSRKTNAILAPDEYIDEKNKDILRIEKLLSLRLSEYIRTLLSEGYTQPQAEKIGLENIKKDREFYMNIHKKKYPKDLKDIKPFFYNL